MWIGLTACTSSDYCKQYDNDGSRMSDYCKQYDNDGSRMSQPPRGHI